MALCPHCQAQLPEPAEHFCPNCGGALTPAAEPPPPGLPPPEVAPPHAEPARAEPPPGIPWEERSRVGFVSGLVDTTTEILKSPTRFFVAARPETGIGGPFLYAMIMGTLGLWVQAVYSLVFNSVTGVLTRMPDAGPFPKLPPIFEGTPGFFIRIVVLPLLLMLWLFIASGITHLALALVGGARRGFEATFAVYCYAQAFAAFNLIPFCGAFIGFPYLFVVLVVGLATVHGINEGHAYAGVVTQMLLICCCGAMAAGFVLTGVAGLAGMLGR
jgi:hypothetical protein